MIDTDLIAAMRASGGRRHTFAEFYLDEATYYLCDSEHNITYNENTYLGAGTLGTIEFTDTKVSKMSGRFTMKLSGVFVGVDGGPTYDAWQAALTETLTGTPLQGRKVKVFTAITDINGISVLHDPNQTMTGIIDVPKALDEGGGVVLSIQVEDRAFLETIVAPRRYSLADHQRLDATSTFMQQTAVLGAKDVNWGKSA